MPWDLLEFITKIIGAIAWPLAILIIVILFRSELKKVFLSITKLRYKEFEAEFGKKAEEFENRAKSVTPHGEVLSSHKHKTSITDEFLDRLLVESPRIAVIEAFRMVEEAIRNTATFLNLGNSDNRGIRYTIRELERQNYISRETKNLFYEMRSVRNDLSHANGIELAEADARRFVNAAFLLADQFYRI